MERFNLSGICGKNRHEGINKIEHIVNNHGYIIDFKRFSDISINLIIEIEKNKIDSLYHDLDEFMFMEEFNKLNSTSTKECTVFLNVTFKRGLGNVRIKVPNVPG